MDGLKDGDDDRAIPDRQLRRRFVELSVWRRLPTNCAHQ